MTSVSTGSSDSGMENPVDAWTSDRRRSTRAAARPMFSVPTALTGLALVVDQLLLPMFHIGTFPYKPSYLLLALWLVASLNQSNEALSDPRRLRDARRFSYAIAVIVGCALLGDLAVSAVLPVASHAETVRSTTIYVLVILSFWLGINAGNFDLRWLLWVAYTSITLNLAFALLRTAIPEWLSDFYYDELTVQAFGPDSRIQTAEDLLNWTRPRGIFPNPNATMLMVNVIIVFIYAGLRARLLRIESGLVAAGIVVLPIALAAVLASRGEFIVSVLLGIGNYRQVFRNPSRRMRRNMRMILAVVVIALIGVVSSLREDSDIFSNISRIGTLLDIIEAAERGGSEARNQGITRPLLTFESARDRFVYSPVFGTGYSTSDRYPFIGETLYYHNDWFRLLVTSGLIGMVAMLWIIRNYCLPLGILTILPFFVSGMTNTFMLNIPAIMFYFFMIGVFRNKRLIAAAGQTRSGVSPNQVIPGDTALRSAY